MPAAWFRAATDGDGLAPRRRNRRRPTQRHLLRLLNTGAACTAADVIIRAVVNFQQVPAGAVTRTYVQSWSVNR